MEPSMENTTFRNNFISEKDLPLHFCSGGFLCKDETYYLKRRNLNQYLLLYTIGGEGFLSYEGREYRLLPGMTFLIDCRKDHIYHTANKHWEFSFVHFRAEALREYVEWIAPVTVYPGEDELLALTQGALRVLTGEEEAKEY